MEAQNIIDKTGALALEMKEAINEWPLDRFFELSGQLPSPDELPKETTPAQRRQYNIHRAKALCTQVYAYNTVGKYDQGEHTFMELYQLRGVDEIDEQLAITCLGMVETYLNTEQGDKAFATFNIIGSFGNYGRIPEMKAAVLLTIGKTFISKNNKQGAMKCFRLMDTLGDAEAVVTQRSEWRSLVIRLDPGVSRESEELFRQMKTLPASTGSDKHLYQTYAELIVKYTWLGQPDKAWQLYTECCERKTETVEDMNLGWITFNIILSLLFTGQTEKAAQMTADFRSAWPATTKGEQTYEHYLGLIKESMENPSDIFADDITQAVEKAEALTQQMMQAAAEHRLEDARTIFEELKTQADLPRINQLIYQQYANLLRDYAAAGSIDKAEEIYAECLASDRQKDMDWEVRWVTVKMIEALLSDGQTARATAMRDEMKASAPDGQLDQSWLNYYMSELDKAFANPAGIYGTPQAAPQEQDTENTQAAGGENDANIPDTDDNSGQQTEIKRTWETEGRDFWCGSNYELHNGYAFLRKPGAERNFWQQPGRFTESTRPRTEAEIADFERRMGYHLPELFRSHLKQQNGGDIRYDTYVDGDNADPVFYEGTIQGIPAIGGPYETLSDTYGTYMDPENWDEALGEGANPDRLHVLSYLDGHSILCLDYGVTAPEPYPQPQVVLYDTEMDFEERLRVESYEKLINHLVYNETSYFVGVKADMTLDQLKDHLTQTLLPDAAQTDPAYKSALESIHIDFEFKRQDYDPHYAWDYDYHYVAMILLDRKKFIVRLMPNQYRGGNHVFQDDTDCNFILDIDPSDGGYGRAMVGPGWIEHIIGKFEAPGIEARIILPTPVTPVMFGR